MIRSDRGIREVKEYEDEVETLSFDSEKVVVILVESMEWKPDFRGVKRHG